MVGISANIRYWYNLCGSNLFKILLKVTNNNYCIDYHKYVNICNAVCILYERYKYWIKKQNFIVKCIFLIIYNSIGMYISIPNCMFLHKIEKIETFLKT